MERKAKKIKGNEKKMSRNQLKTKEKQFRIEGSHVERNETRLKRKGNVSQKKQKQRWLKSQKLEKQKQRLKKTKLEVTKNKNKKNWSRKVRSFFFGGPGAVI